MHIRPAEPGQPDGRQHESGTVRKVRLGGGASRVPVQTSKETAETPLRALVSAIGQSLGTRTPLRGQTAGTRTQSSVKSSLFSSSSSSTPADSTRSKSLFSAEGRTNGTSSAAVAARSTGAAGSSSRIPSTPKSSRTQATAGTPSKVPATPISSRVQATPATPSTRRSSLSSSSSYTSSSNSGPSNSTKKESTSSSTPSSRRVPATPSSRKVPATPSSRKVSATPSSRKVPATPSAASRKLDASSIPVTKKSSMAPRTSTVQNKPTTPSSKPSCIPLPTPRRLAVSSTPGPKQASTTQTRSKSFFPTTPVSKHTSANPPTTPVSGVESDNGFRTPYGQNGSNQTFYTPTATLPLTPLQPRNTNVPELSRKLHFGINVAAMVDQENMGNNTTPRPASAVITETTFSFDKNRLAQIKARKNSSQLLKSPAQRIRAPDLHHPSQTPNRTPGRVLQQVAEDRSSRFDEGVVVTSLNHSPARRRVANALF